MISKKIKARIFLITILLLFSAPFIASWYLVFYSDFKQGDDGVENGILISPVIELGEVEANVIGLDKKERVYDIEMTSYGKYLLSIGQYKPDSYAFFDDNVVYDNMYNNISESQNSINERIKKETPYISTLTIFEDINKTSQTPVSYTHLTLPTILRV